MIKQDLWIWQDLAISSGRDRVNSQWDGRVKASDDFIFLSNCLSLDFSKNRSWTSIWVQVVFGR